MQSKSILCGCLILSSLASCKKDCKETDIMYVGINNSSHTAISSVVIKRYNAAKNFDNVLDSAILDIPTLSAAETTAVSYRFTGGYEYSITLLPVGRTYKVTDIHFGTEKTSASEEDDCYTSYDYKVDGKLDDHEPVYYGYIFITI